MNRAKISSRLTSNLIPAAVLYLCCWLLDEVGKLVAGIVFTVLCVNYFRIMRNIKLIGTSNLVRLGYLYLIDHFTQVE